MAAEMKDAKSKPGRIQLARRLIERGQLDQARALLMPDGERPTGPRSLAALLLLADRLEDDALLIETYAAYVAGGFDPAPEFLVPHLPRLALKVEAIGRVGAAGPVQPAMPIEAPGQATRTDKPARRQEPRGSDVADPQVVEGLRLELRAATASNDALGARRILRRIRRVAGLTPTEYRRYYNLLAQIGAAPVVERYIRTSIAAREAGVLDSATLVNRLWAAGHLDDLKAELQARLPSERVQMLQRLAFRSLRARDRSTATSLFGWAAEAEPDNPVVQSCLAALELERGDYAAAFAHAIRAGVTSEAASPPTYNGLVCPTPDDIVASLADLSTRRLKPDDVRQALSTVEEMRLLAPDHAGLQDIQAYLLAHRAASEKGAVDDYERQPTSYVSEGLRSSTADSSDARTFLEEASADGARSTLAALRLLPQTRTGRELARLGFEQMLADHDSTDEADVADLVEAAANNQDLVPALSRWLIDNGRPEQAMDLFHRAPSGPPTFWLDAFNAAEDLGDTAHADEFVARLFSHEGASAQQVRDVQRRLDQRRRDAASTAVYAARLAPLVDRPKLIFTAAKQLFSDKRFRECVAAAELLIGPHGPETPLSPDDSQSLIDLVRIAVAASLKLREGEFQAHGAWRIVAEDEALRRWVSAMSALAHHDFTRAADELKKAIELSSVQDVPSLCYPEELALVYLKYHFHGEALAALKQVPAVRNLKVITPLQLSTLGGVAELCGPGQNLYPECLVDVMFEELSAAGPLGYAPEDGHLLTICGTLGPGGGERQAVTVIQRLSETAEVRRQTLVVRALDPEPNAFFLPAVSSLPMNIHHYGVHWKKTSDLATVVPELKDRPRLRRAIELLPHNVREGVARVLRILLDEKPAVVHLRQDLFAAALACAIAGVPRFFVHRGSLSRNTWEHTGLQAQIQLRPMVHIYRKLLTETPFFMVNNSAAGRTSDVDWTGVEDQSRFHVLHNAVDFRSLGDNTGRNLNLRAELGLPEDAFVLGGAFRLVGVKRPMLWLDIARQVVEQFPKVHLLIIGDGDMKAEMLDYAAAHGFADRLHLPGAQQDVASWYRAMDLSLLTSEREGLPNTLIESQHFGVPVVSADVGGAAETMIAGKTGLLVAPNAGSEPFAAAIAGAITDEAWYANAVEEGQRFVHERFGPEHTVQRLLKYFEFAA
jgi:glycosyltransferase involved in cell wall biosynthesis